jgi:hypothetical protein
VNDATVGGLYTEVAAGAAALGEEAWLLGFRGPWSVDVGLERVDARLRCEDCDDIVEHAGLGTEEQSSGASSLSSSSATLAPVTRKRLWLHDSVLAVWMQTSQSRHSNARSSRQKKNPRFSYKPQPTTIPQLSHTPHHALHSPTLSKRTAQLPTQRKFPPKH